MKRLPQATLGLLLLIAAPAVAQEPAVVGTLLVAHGASAEWNAQVEQLAAQAQLHRTWTYEGAGRWFVELTS